MKNSLNNVDRGMNIALVNGKTGESLKQVVFDLYGKGSVKNVTVLFAAEIFS